MLTLCSNVILSVAKYLFKRDYYILHIRSDVLLRA